jgi:hypothetical protein
MNPPAGGRERPSADGLLREAPPAIETRGPDVSRNAQPAARPANAQRQASVDLRFRSQPVVNEALKDARRFIRVRYYSFLGSIVLLFVTLVVSAAVLAVSLLSDGAWEAQAGAGAIAGVALLLLIFLQYSPAAGFATAAAELAQLEALRAHLERSYDFWDAFLEDRETNRVVANDVAIAVSSMTSATRELVAAQAEFVVARRGGRNAGDARPRLPTPTTPDPRRY